MALASVAIAEAQSLLSDAAALLAGPSLWSEDVLTPFLQQAHRELQDALWAAGKTEQFRKTSGAIAVTLGALDLGAGQPTDLLAPIALSEKVSAGAITTYVPMTEVFDIPIEAQAVALRYWAWKGGLILFLGSTTGRDVQITYRAKITEPTPVSATGVLTSDNVNVTTGDPVTVGGKTYTFRTALTSPAVPNEVLIGSDADDSLLNLKKAVNAEAGIGTKFSLGTTKNLQVSAGAVITHAITFTAIVGGTSGNDVATTEASTHLSWGNTLLVGGVGAGVASIGIIQGELFLGPRTAALAARSVGGDKVADVYDATAEKRLQAVIAAQRL